MRRVACVIALLICCCFVWAASVEAGKSGIWKPADQSNNFYIQTYDTGSCIVIVTPDGQNFYVFLEDSFVDEIEAQELFGRPASLNLAVTGEDTASASLQMEGEVTDYTLTQVFQGDCRNGVAGSQAGKSGIWKPADQSNNFYIQTYDTGSCIVIVTPDGQNFYVFLEDSFADEIEAQELFGRSASLNLAITGDDTASASLQIGGEVTNYTLTQVFQGDCRNGGANGTFTNSLGMVFNYIPPGTFMMGSPSSEMGRRTDETQHQVTLSNGFYLQTTEVTQGQWKAVMGSNPSGFGTCGDDCPVEMVSWVETQAFITQLNTLGEGTYRLPTEAEWEYAARASSSTAFANGEITTTECELDPNLDVLAWYCYNSDDKTHPAALKNANVWGLYDMHGNVWEWCQDWYAETYPSGAVTDPTGPSSGMYRVVRGGGWINTPRNCRSANRGYQRPESRFDSFGVRLVRSFP